MRHGRLNCPEKNIWCLWIDFDTGACTRSGECDVGSEAWKERQEEKEKVEMERRRKAEEIRRIEEEAERKKVEIKRQRTELQDISAEIQHLEARMCRCYQRGQERRADELLWKITKLKRKVEELKNEGKK